MKLIPPPDPRQAVMSSADGFTWTIRTGTATADLWNKIAFGNGIFVAIGSKDAGASGNFLMTSINGIDWTEATINPTWADYWFDIYFGNGLFIAQGGAQDFVMTSPDGLIWTQHARASVESCYGTAFGNGTFVAVSGTGSGSTVMTSTNGTVWVAGSGTAVAQNW